MQAAQKNCNQLNPGQTATVLNVSGNVQLQNRLQALGVCQGAEVGFVRRAPFGCPVEICVCNAHIALSAQDAAAIQVSAA